MDKDLTTLTSQEQVGTETDPLALDIPDTDLCEIVDKKIDDTKKELKKDGYFESVKRNETFLFGRQISEREARHELKPYESRYLYNALYEIEASIKPLATSKLPDMIVIPGHNQNTPDNKLAATSLTDITNGDLKKRENRKVLSMAFKHLPVAYFGAIKARWNPEYNDYCFDNVYYDDIVFDQTAKENNSDKMKFIAERLHVTIQDVLMRFPDKKQEFLSELKSVNIQLGETPSWKSLATPIDIWEVWFTWYVQKKDDESEGEYGDAVDEGPDKQDGLMGMIKGLMPGKRKIATSEADKTAMFEPGIEWERVEGVLWKYGKCILAKMKNPNFDYDGEEKMYIQDDPADPSTKREIEPEDVMFMLTNGVTPQISKEKVYANYFKYPRKPYYFMGYDQWGKKSVDETSRIEQNIRNQENMDERGKIIRDTLRERGKHVFSKEGGMNKKIMESMDLNNPDQDVLMDGDVGKFHAFIPPRQVSAQEFNDLANTKSNMFSIAGATNLQGTLQSDVATSNQIAREADYTRNDDLTEDTINAASEWMAGWILQFIKLRYTEDHFKELEGKDGSIVYKKIQQNLVDKSMGIRIKASGSDKLKAQRNAMDMAKLDKIDPLTFFEDMDLSDPEGRTEKWADYQAGVATGDFSTYIVKWVKKMETTGQQIDGLLGAGSAQAMAQPMPFTPPPGMPPQQPPMGGQPPMAPTGTPPQPAPPAMSPPVGPPQGSVRSL